MLISLDEPRSVPFDQTGPDGTLGWTDWSWSDAAGWAELGLETPVPPGTLLPAGAVVGAAPGGPGHGHGHGTAEHR